MKGLVESRLFPIIPEAHECYIVGNGLRRMSQSYLAHNELLTCSECLAHNSAQVGMGRGITSSLAQLLSSWDTLCCHT